MLRLGNITTANTFAQHVGRFGSRFVVSERTVTGVPAMGSNIAGNLALHDGQTRVPITHNGPGSVAEAHLLFGELLVAQSQFDTPTQSRPTRTDIYHYTPAGTVNLTNNPPQARTRIAAGGGPGALFMLTDYDAAQPAQSDLLYARLDGTPAIRVTTNEPGQTVYIGGVIHAGGSDLFEVNSSFSSAHRSDVFAFDGASSINLTNHPSGVHGRIAFRAGPDAIIYRSGGAAPATSYTNLLRYHDGTLTAFTHNPPGMGSTVVETVGRTVLFHEGSHGTDVVNGRSNLLRNDGGATNVRLTDNSAGMHMRLIRTGEHRVIEISDNRNGVFPHQTSENFHLLQGDASISLSNNPVGLHFRGDPQPLRGGFWFATEDFRGGTNANQKISDLFVYEHGLVRRLTNNGLGVSSWDAYTGTGDDVVFHTTRFPQSGLVPDRTDVMLYDGQMTRNVTNFPPNGFGHFEGMLGSDLLVSVFNRSSSSTHDLVRYTSSGQARPLTQNTPVLIPTLLHVTDDRAVWMTSDQSQFPASITGIFAGNGLSPTETVFEPPAGQKMTLPFPLSTYGGIRFFSLEGGTGDGRFSNIIAYSDGRIVPLTDNGPGWLAQLYLPQYYPHEPLPDAIVSDVALIALTNISGDRRDVIVLLLPEPGWAGAAFACLTVTRLRRTRRRG